MSKIMDSLEANRVMANIDEQRKVKRNRYWEMLRKSQQDYINLTRDAAAEVDTGIEAFYYYLQQNYGLKVEIIDGHIAGDYNIIDEKKYTMFLLKYGS